MEPIIVKYMDYPEYTVDYLADESYNVKLVVPRKRLEHKAGEVWKTQTVKDYYLMKIVGNIVKKCELKYVGFVQLFYNEETKEYWVSEVDSRFGGGISCSIKAGAPMFKMLYNVLDGKYSYPPVTWRELTFTRYLEEFQLWNKE